MIKFFRKIHQKLLSENYIYFELQKKYDDDLYFHFYQAFEEFIQYDSTMEPKDNQHQMLGHDRSIQSSVVYDFAANDLGIHELPSSEYKNRWNEILEQSKTYELLLQIDCFDPNTDIKKYGSNGK